MLSAPDSILRRLILLRALTVSAYAVAMLIGGLALDWALPLVSLSFICLLLVGYNLLAIGRLRLRLARRGYPAGDAEVARQLAVDIVGHGLWLFFVGGATNPFTAMFLLPLTIAAASLPGRYVWPLTALTLATYSTLMIWYMPLPIPETALAQAFFLHTVGMWLAFVAAALIVAGLVARIGRQLRDQQRELHHARERGLRQQQVMGLAIQAAGAAHRLGTPLATMTVLVDELAAEHAGDRALAADLALLRQQLAACRDELQRLRAAGEAPEALPADAALLALLDDWRVVRPAQRCETAVLGGGEPPRVAWDFTLRQSLMNLLDNAADASPDWQRLTLDWSAGRLRVGVEDAGAGFDGVARTCHEDGEGDEDREGLGVGVALAVSAIERSGGRVDWRARPGGGTRAEIELPVLSA